MRKILSFAHDENGATAVEYGLIAALICVAIIGSLSTFGTELGNVFNKVETAVTNVTSGSGSGSGSGTGTGVGARLLLTFTPPITARTTTARIIVVVMILGGN